MSGRQRVQKLEGHAAALLDAYRGLRQAFALLEPLLPSAVLGQTLGRGPSGEGLAELRHILFLSCALDVAKLCLDRDKRTPSVTKLVEDLDTPELIEHLRSRASSVVLPRRDREDVHGNGLQGYEEDEQGSRATAFDKQLRDLREGWQALKSWPPMSQFRVLRDKYIAHLELRPSEGGYAPIDLDDLGLKWSDVGDAVNAMEPLVCGANAVIRSADFDMASAVAHFEKVRDDFWSRAQ